MAHRFPDWLRIGLVAAIGVVQLWVLSLALYPRVPERYRAYYIDRITDCWPLEVSGEYKMGETISFLKPAESVRAISRCGWAEPTHEGVWSLGPEARLWFRLDGPPLGNLHLELEIFGFVTATHQAHRVSIVANDTKVADLTIRSGTPSRQLIVVPNSAVSGADSVEFTFNLPDAITPRSQNLGPDRRRLAVRLVSLRLAPAPVVATLGSLSRPAL